MAKVLNMEGEPQIEIDISGIPLTKKKQSDITEQELSEIPFKCVCHLAMADEHVATHSDESGRLGFCTHTPKKDEFTFGKGRTHYRIDGKIYKSKKKFLEALKEFSFKVVPIR